MILYHGTNKAFDTIDLTKSKPNKDFGQGFYLSREYRHTCACKRTKRNYTTKAQGMFIPSSPMN
ncbi:MAG: DUF3990 domain-containing protein [Paludibacteraceae bacterium]|nr:DUF3990 domain-containing protein [Paludibacteraceae bacterium]